MVYDAEREWEGTVEGLLHSLLRVREGQMEIKLTIVDDMLTTRWIVQSGNPNILTSGLHSMGQSTNLTFRAFLGTKVGKSPCSDLYESVFAPDR